MKESHKNGIAIIGMSGRFPGAKNTDEFWKNLVQGRETISFFSNKELQEAGIQPSEYKNPKYVKAKGIINNIDEFDPNFFGYPPKEVEKMDPQIRLLHECCWEALEVAGYIPGASMQKTGLYLGANENHEWLQRIISQSTNTNEYYDTYILNQRDYIATRISYNLDLKGPSFTVLSACSTSLVTVHLACQAIKNGNCNMALAGGVSLSYPSKSGYLYQEGFMVSSDGHCKAFDAHADGTVFGDGAGIVLLKQLDQALKDNDTIYAVIKGSAINNDGNNKSGFTAPSVEGQARAIRAAHKEANIQPDKIGYVETHGTGTSLGDPIEFQALKKAFNTKKKNYCFIGSVKTNIGHINIAAGVTSLIKTALCLYKKNIPPTLHFNQPNPKLDIKNSPFQINNQLKKWSANGYPRSAGVSAFGFGGTNAHFVLEEAPEQAPSNKSGSQYLFLLSAQTPSSLKTNIKNLGVYLKENKSVNMSDIAFTLAVGRKHFPYRKAVVCSNYEEAIIGLDNDVTPVKSVKNPKLIFMFPGQGSQYPNMGRKLYETEPEFRKQVDYCSKILEPHLNLSIKKMIYPHAEGLENAELLKQTRFSQPAVFIISYALSKLWMSWGVKPDIVIGHSIGECAAACVAGVMDVEEGLKLIAKRSELMQNMPPGGMLAVSLSERSVVSLLSNDLSLAAVNGPKLTVVSGPLGSLENMKNNLKERGIASRFLPTSHAFHSSMMDAVTESIRQVCEKLTLKEPQIPIMSTVTGDWIRKGEITNPDYWVNNLRQTVLFSPAVNKTINETEGIFLEVGPGNTLCHLVRMHSQQSKRKITVASLPVPTEKREEDDSQLFGICQLWEAGINPNWHSFYASENRRRIPLPTYAFDRHNFWLKPIVPNGPNINPQIQLDRKITDVGDWFSVPSWKRSILPHSQNNKKLTQSCFLIFMDKCGIGRHIANKLESSGHEVIKLFYGEKYMINGENDYVVNPKKSGDFKAVIKKLEQKQKIPNKIIHLWNINYKKEYQSKSTSEQVLFFQQLGFLSLLHIAQSIGKVNLPGEIHLYVVSNNLQEVTGSENIIPEKAPLLGPVKVIPQEYPNVKCCSIDIHLEQNDNSESERVSNQVLTEVKSDIPEVIVAYRNNHRWIQSYEKVYLEKQFRKKFNLRKDGVYMITGGLGGLGSVFVKFLSRTESVKLILTTRKFFPSRVNWDEWLLNHQARDPISKIIKKLQKLEKHGAHIEVISADVTSRNKLKIELERVEKSLGPINGVIHAAGLPGEGIIQLKKPGEAMKVLSPKVEGTINLHDILNNRRLDFFVLCSSIASVLGGIGLSDYCAANSFQDAFALKHQNGTDQNIISINWDMWGQVGMGLKTQMPDEHKEWYERELRNGITSSEGIDVLQRIIAWSGHPNIVVSTRVLQARIDLWLRRELIKKTEKDIRVEKQSNYSRASLSNEYTKPISEIEKKVAWIWSKLFGIEKIGRQDSFYELGGHSLLAMTLLSELRKTFGSTISIQDVIDNPTVSKLSLLIEKYQKSKQKDAHGKA